MESHDDYYPNINDWFLWIAAVLTFGCSSVLSIIGRFVEKSELKETSDENALHNAICDERWDECRSLLGRDDALRLVEHVGVTGDHAAHVACVLNAPADVTASISRIHPPILSRPSQDGSVPLHVACSTASEEVVELLLREAPRTAACSASLVTRNSGGGLPLRAAVDCRRSPSVIKKLLAVHPAAVHAVTDGRTHFWWFLKVWEKEFGRVGPDVDSLATSDRYGVDGRTNGLETFQRTFSWMLMAYVRGTVVVTEYEWLLVHEAIRYHCVASIPTMLITTILQTTVRSECDTPDEKGNFPLHVACGQPGHRVD